MEFTTIHKSLNLSGFKAEPVEDQLNYTSPSLEKSVLADAFGYNSSMSNRVLGSEIKAGLEKIVAFSSKKEKEYKSEMAKYLKEAKATPTKSPGRYVTKGLDAFIPDVPKCFDYKQIEECIQMERKKNPEYSYSECPMGKYNDVAREYIACCVEGIYAKAMMSGISESQFYYLNVRQATQVGIGS